MSDDACTCESWPYVPCKAHFCSVEGHEHEEMPCWVCQFNGAQRYLGRCEAVVHGLAKEDPYDDDHDCCAFCDRDRHETPPHRDDCLWKCAVELREEGSS